MQVRAGCETEPPDTAGIRRNLGLDKDDVEDFRFQIGDFRLKPDSAPLLKSEI
jgi:hypothetical protein